MYFLLSGEGPTDIGLCSDGMNACEGNSHLKGPMAIIISQLVEQRLQFSFMDTRYYGYVSKRELVNRASIFKSEKKSLRLPGKKKPKETGYFYRNARALALCAKDKEVELNDKVIAVFFRDSDGTASADRGLCLTMGLSTSTESTCRAFWPSKKLCSIYYRWDRSRKIVEDRY